MTILLGPVLGAVTHTTAKIWIYWDAKHENEGLPHCHVFKDQDCTQRISESPFVNISGSAHQCGAIQGVAALAKVSFHSGGAKFYFRVVSGSSQKSENDKVYSIRPFPEIGADIGSLSFGLISCHHPSFKPKKNEKIVSSMWRHLGEQMRKHNCRFLIQAGDQVYADHKKLNAWAECLKEVPQEKRLWHYRQTYLTSWNFPEVQKVMRTFPQYMIWDDHEITNGWGSDKKHSEDDKCKSAFRAARQAYLEFQHSHNPDPLREGRFYYAFNFGPAAFLFLDLRGHRDITGYDADAVGSGYPLAGKEQWDDIKAWLKSERIQKAKILFVVASVPVLHLSRKWRDLGFLKNDIRDQWSAPHNKAERRILLDLLFNWSGQEKKPVFILGGDVHVGTVAQAAEVVTRNRFHQITSSPITHTPAWLLDLFLQVLSEKFAFHLKENDRRPVHGRIIKRFRSRNFAIIEITFRGERPRVRLYMYKGWRMLRVNLTKYDFSGQNL